MTTPHQAKYWALALTTSGQLGSIASLTGSIANARVDLNPHQVDAALFGLKSPISKGAILADEVGLGKTIEAGLVIVQRWAERKRKILLIVPATLRKQWQQELDEKFFLPSTVLESSSYKRLKQSGHVNPFDQTDTIVICSYHFAAAKQEDVSVVPWNLSVIDEAHRLRNVYKPSNKLAAAIKESLQDVPKLLLTATPLQNSLMELYGLVSVIDEHVFGDKYSFRAQFTGKRVDEETRNWELKERLGSVCIRALRRQVNEYVRFTQRTSITEEFTPTDEEHELYERVSAYLQREKLISLPNAQRKLITLVLRKLLASSTFAIGATLKKLAVRLDDTRKMLDQPDAFKRLREELDQVDEIVPPMADEYESIGELQDEWEEETVQLEQANIEKMKAAVEGELSELNQSIRLADSITANTKGEALIRALASAFAKTESLGAKRKAVVFTESRRTQDYLFRLLNDNGYGGGVVILNGTNADASSKRIYAEWLERHRAETALSGVKAVDIKAAIVEEFRDRAIILVATEAAAEGVNLQFCSLVVNYDLPWNPQRIEQRIGRCHRYGQKHDVVVVNFLNRRNAADQRVFQLLSDKFRLFDGVFGVSDEILGALESGVDIEKRIAELYQSCRTEDEIQKAFDYLQRELDDQIRIQMSQTRQAVLDNFDEEVHKRLKLHEDNARCILDQRQKWLLHLTKFELDGDCELFDADDGFRYTGDLAERGSYWLHWQDAEVRGGNFYRPESRLAGRVLETAMSRKVAPAHLEIRLSDYPAKLSILEELAGQSGWLGLSLLKVSSLQDDQFLILSGATDSGKLLDSECSNKLLSVPARLLAEHVAVKPGDSMKESREAEIKKHFVEVRERNMSIFEDEMTKLDRWAEDLKYGLEQELKDLDVEIRRARKTSRLALSLEEKLEAQKQVKALELKRSTKRRRLFEAQDEIDGRREKLIEDIEKQLNIQTCTEDVFTIRWTLVG
jgi:adenine-specific DNA-methyltransferase